jgi:Kef-type K+ transport system membrane component KefB
MGSDAEVKGHTEPSCPFSQLDLAFFMFIVGMEFRLDIVKRSLRPYVVVSLAGMAVPCTLGAILAWFLHGHTELNIFPSGVSSIRQ